MNSASSSRVIIVGGGLAGALLATYLGRRGCEVIVCERRPDPRRHGFMGGRSINLALSTRGIHALARVGLDEPVLRNAVPMPGRMIHAESGALTFQPYSKSPDDAINSVSRGDLNITLLTAADAMDNVTLRFHHRCLGVDFDRPAATFLNEHTGETTTLEGTAIIGADGAFSAVRGQLQKTDRFQYSQHYLAHGYKELCIPAVTGDGGEPSFAMEPNALHIWPRGGYMMIALPNINRTFTCTLFWPLEGDVGFDAVDEASKVEPFFRRHFPDAVPLIPTLVDDYMHNPIGSLVTIRCEPWHVGGRVALIGDAAHAIVPFYGQGINAGFEDCVVLDECIDQHGGDWPAALSAFSTQRKPDADAIADLALHNFIEMRDHVGSPAFLLTKRLEQATHRFLPGVFTPLYNMVTFSRLPYAEARRRAAHQRRAVKLVLLGLGIVMLAVLVSIGGWILQ